MKVAIHQPNYLPHPAYFLKIKMADIFVFLDDVQLSSGSFTARTDVCGNWLSVPVKHDIKNPFINQAEVCKNGWQRKHLATLHHCFCKSPFYKDALSIIEPVLLSSTVKLIDYNVPLIIRICESLGIKTPMMFSSQFPCNKTGSDKLLHILHTLNATTYLSGTGAGAKRYADPELFSKNGISIEWFNPTHLPKTTIFQSLSTHNPPSFL